MQENLELNKEEISSETWMWILFLFAQSQEIEEQKQYGPLWDKFEEELISKNRFFSDSPVVQEIENTAEKAIKEYPAGSLFYRARIFRGAPSDKFSDYYVKENGGTKKQFEEQLSGLSSMETQWLGLAPLGVALPDDSSEFLQKILATRKKWLKYVRYKGFNAKDSSAPPADKVSEGRVNPAHIRYLYLCEDAETTVYEIAPNLNDLVSIAKFRLKKDIKVFDFALPVSFEQFGTTTLFHLIQSMFSKPNKSNPEKYIATQYLAEKIKNMGFDGIRFCSSLHQGGINVVLFDPEICSVLSSKLVSVSEIKISSVDYLF